MPSSKLPARLSFFQSARQALNSPSFYKSLPQRSVGRALLYFLQWILLFSIVFGIEIGFFWHKVVSPKIVEISSEVQVAYPADLVLELKNGELSSNASAPVLIEWPSSWLNTLSQIEDPDLKGENQALLKNLLIIDTSRDQVSLEEFATYDTLVLLTKHQFISRSDGQISYGNYPTDGDFTLNQETFLSGVTEAFSILENLSQGLIWGGVLLFIPFFWTLGVLLFAIYGAVIWLVAQIFGPAVEFETAYKAGAYASTLSFVLYLGVSLLPFASPLPFMVLMLSPLLTMGWASFMLLRKK